MRVVTPALITTDGDLPEDYEFYIINAATTSIQIRLPYITTDGLYCRLRRIDTNASNTVTIVPSDPSQFINGNTQVIMDISSRAEVVSMNNIWYFI